MANFEPYEQGGITGKTKQQALVEALQGSGGTAGVQSPPMQAEAPAAPAAQKPSFQFNQGNVLGVLRGYDPTPGGLEKAFSEHPELTQAGSRISKLNSGKIYDPTTGRDVDVGLSFGSGGGKGWWWGDDSGGATQTHAPMNPMFGGSNINGMLQSDAQGNIQQALSALQQPGMLQQLIAALQGGQ